MTKLWKLKAGRKKTDRFAYIKKKKSLYMEKKQNKTKNTSPEAKSKGK